MSTDATLVHVSTEKFWEQCLELALESAFGRLAVSRDTQAGEGVSVPAPWAILPSGRGPFVDSATSSFPDFMLRTGQQTIVADAKYKLGTGRAPSSSDGYQLFAYSHLATLDSRPADLAVLLYPTRNGGRTRQVALSRLRDCRYPLWLAHLPFPRPSDLRRQQNWSSYIASLAGHLRVFAKEWV